MTSTGRKLTNIDVYNKSEYFGFLIRALNDAKAGDSITVASMSFKPEEKGVREITMAMTAASKRGAKVRLVVDAYCLLFDNGIIPGPFMFGDINRLAIGSYKIRRSIMRRLQEQGIGCVLLNKPTSALTMPFKGRCHIKFALINDYVMIGGCNLSVETQTDIMLGWNDKRLANKLTELASKLADSELSKDAIKNDQILDERNNSKVIIDCGTPGKSAIFEAAVSMIQNAKSEIYLSCQFFPNDTTIHRLKMAADRGVSVTLAYNHPSQHPFPHNVLHHIVGRMNSRHARNICCIEIKKPHNFLHAKILIVDDNVMVGSHNYVKAGVDFGTAEMAVLINNNTDLIQQLKRNYFGRAKK